MKNTDTIIILGTSRSQGNSRKTVHFMVEKWGFDFVDLNDFDISYFDYDHKNEGDDFLPLMEKIIGNYGCIIFVTPVYWYTMSAVMKTFLDRISDLLKIRKPLGRQLRGKTMALISVSESDDVDYDFELPFRMSAKYLGMPYLGHTHAVIENGKLSDIGKRRLTAFLEK